MHTAALERKMGGMGCGNVMGSNDPVLLWFLQAGEVVVPLDTGFDPAQHLTYNNIAVDIRILNNSLLSSPLTI